MALCSGGAQGQSQIPLHSKSTKKERKVSKGGDSERKENKNKKENEKERHIRV
jgi:hypothetical protein